MDQSSSDDEDEKFTQKSDSEEKPLKKARYLWQIKGKRHLKRSKRTKRTNGASSKDETSWSEEFKKFIPKTPLDSYLAASSSRESWSKCPNSDNSNNCTRGDSSVLDNSGFPPSSFKCHKLLNKVPQSNNKLPSSSDSKHSKSDSDDGMMQEESERIKIEKSYERYLLEYWQEKQMTRCLLDNTMNRMMEGMEHSPQTSSRSRGNRIEDEGVMMAIQHHGLQHRNSELQDQSSENKNKLVSSVSSLQQVNISECSSSQLVPASIEQHCDLSQVEHDSILDAAVAVAIQKKGLSVFPDSENS